MATKHYSPDTTANTLVPRALRALASANAHLKLNEAEGVVAHAHNDLSVMSIMGGWRSGHEPAWSGFVREGLWSAVACGDIFAYSSTKQVLEAMGLAPLDADVTLLINNYDGLSVLSWGSLTDEVQTQLASTWNIKPARTLPGTLKTFLNAQGFSISLVNISATARQSNTAAPELLRLLDRHTTSVSWPNTARPQEADHTKGPSVNVNVRHSAQKAQKNTAATTDMKLDPHLPERAI
ncbi:Dihydroxyacetone kinase [Colletotrichum sidae]|uniref:Dihydroxyacetone kinase n=1 Tax=Colletotrichum sidae TaxID=1347389 RepID=A0A4R8T578_9PEZI|nr:Dihydroxyacetone kinase [Colletotrichum sidae]